MVAASLASRSRRKNGGVEIVHVRAGGKVILAAGSLSTPRVLFNSGIGPSKQLKTVQGGSSGVTLPPSSEWINLPVGHNFKDHPMWTITVDTRSNFTTFNTSSVIPGANKIAQRLYSEGSGVLSQGGHRLQFWTSNEGSDGNTRFLPSFMQLQRERRHYDEAVPDARRHLVGSPGYQRRRFDDR